MTRPRRHHPSESINDCFSCCHCFSLVSSPESGTEHRNHCPLCLWSLHVDVLPGDRRCACRGKLEPISVWVRQDGEWALIHRCERCGTLRPNRIAGDDNPALLLALGARPLANPAFPLEQLAKLGGVSK